MSLNPVVHASSEEEEEEVELVDPQDTLKTECAETNHCAKLNSVVSDCTARISSLEEKTGETCTEEFFEFVHCVDHCVAKHLFKHLK